MNTYTVTVPCKSYVKKFLIDTYGNPVDIRKDKHLYKFLKNTLERKVHRHNDRSSFKKYGKMIYKAETTFIVNEDTFKHNGFDIHRDDITDLNALFEGYIKKIIAVFVYALISCGHKTISAINQAQELFNFSEDDMSTDLILKSCKREQDLKEKIFSQASANFSQASADFKTA